MIKFHFHDLPKNGYLSEHLQRHTRYGLQFILHLLDEFVDLLCLWKQHIIKVALRKFSGYSKLVRSLHLLIEVAAHPTEILLVFAEELHRLSQDFYFPYSRRIIELLDSITDHRADVTLIG